MLFQFAGAGQRPFEYQYLHSLPVPSLCTSFTSSSRPSMSGFSISQILIYKTWLWNSDVFFTGNKMFYSLSNRYIIVSICWSIKNSFYNFRHHLWSNVFCVLNVFKSSILSNTENVCKHNASILFTALYSHSFSFFFICPCKFCFYVNLITRICCYCIELRTKWFFCFSGHSFNIHWLRINFLLIFLRFLFSSSLIIWIWRNRSDSFIFHYQINFSYDIFSIIVCNFAS